MSNVRIRDDRIYAGDHLSFTLQRTLRLPDDGRTYPLPPGFGPFPVKRVEDYADRVPPHWQERGGLFVPLYQREALWLQFEAPWWRPNAVKVGAGGINAVSGGPWQEGLKSEPQDYVVCPDQPWLDGINVGEGLIRQFVAVPLGRGETVEEQLTGAHEVGGMQLRVFEPKPGRFPDAPPPGGGVRFESAFEEIPSEMGVAAGGRMHQKIYPDQYGIDTWDQDRSTEVFIHLVNSRQYRAITGLAPPSSPVSPRLYTEMGLPWFDLYDEGRGDVAAPERLKSVKSLSELDSERGERPERPDEGLVINPGQVITIKPDREDQ